MEKILRVDADPQHKSVLRELADRFFETRTGLYPQIEVIERDLALAPPPHLASDTDIHTLFGRQDIGEEGDMELAALSRTLIDELFAADRLVIAAPMYNMSVPSILKAWIDLVVRARKTFRFTPNGAVPLLPAGKKALLILAVGGIYSRGLNNRFDFLSPYLRAVLEFIGINDIEMVTAEGLSLGPEPREQALDAARKQLAHLAKHW